MVSWGVALFVETPPLAWGGLSITTPCNRSIRNTPTRVGRTVKSRSSIKAVRKHPHSRGEDSTTSLEIAEMTETPPLAWGGRPWGEGKVPMGGNTPTRVGRTAPGPWVDTPYGKHPHSRGEDTPSSAPSPKSSETPPLAWGGPDMRGAAPMGLGNTPTRVGRTRK